MLTNILQLPLGTQKGRRCQKQNRRKETRSHSGKHIPPCTSFCDSSRQKPASGVQISASLGAHAANRDVRPGRRDAAPQQQDPAVAKLKRHDGHKNPRVHPSYCSVHLQHSNKS